MEFKEFKKRFNNASKYLDPIRHKKIRDKCKEIFARDLEFKNSGRVYVITGEECSELQQAVSKVLRGKGNKLKLIEEIADVEICLEYIKELQGISESDINKAKNVKDDRSLQRIKETGKCW